MLTGGREQPFEPVLFERGRRRPRGLPRFPRGRRPAQGLDDAVGIEHQHVAGLHDHEAALVARLGKRPQHRPARFQLGDRAVGGEVERRRMAGVDVDEDAVELELAVEQRHEAAGQRAAVDDAIHALDGAHDLEISRQAHAQTHVDVTHLQRGGQAMPRDVGDRQAEDLVGDRNVIEEITADGLHRHGAPVQVEVAIGGGAARQDRRLDLALLLEDPFHALAPQLLVDAVTHDAEREQDVLAVVAGGDVEGQDVLLVADLDGGESLHSQQVLQLLVHPRIVGVHEDRPVFGQQLDRRIGDRHLPRGTSLASPKIPCST